MAEIALWQERASVLNALSEQLNHAAVGKIVEVMTKAGAGIVLTLEGAIAELTKYRLESDENLRFLKTLERHFMVRTLLLTIKKKGSYMKLKGSMNL